MKQNRLNSKVAWASLIGAIALALNSFGVFEQIGISDEVFLNIANTVLATLVAFGILNDPTNADGF